VSLDVVSSDNGRFCLRRLVMHLTIYALDHVMHIRSGFAFLIFLGRG
jgi:hypothetical protein